MLWGKFKENKEMTETAALEFPIAIKSIEGNGKGMDIIDSNDVVIAKDTQKA